MGTNDDFYAKELNLNYFYTHSNSEQKYPKTAIVYIVREPSQITFAFRSGWVVRKMLDLLL